MGGDDTFFSPLKFLNYLFSFIHYLLVCFCFAASFHVFSCDVGFYVPKKSSCTLRYTFSLYRFFSLNCFSIFVK